MKYEKFDILKKAKYSIVPNNRELYVVYVECDANDGDYMRDTIEFDKESFEEDELLLLVLSYVSKYSGRFLRKDGTLQDMGTMQMKTKIFLGCRSIYLKMIF